MRNKPKRWDCIGSPEDLPHFPKNTLIFLDVDDTLITPVSRMFQHRDTCDVIETIKKEKPLGWERLVSQWRYQRRVALTRYEWPYALMRMKRRYRVYGLTLFPFGAFGTMPCVESWRYQELVSFGLRFSEDSPFKDPSQEKALVQSVNCAFYKGIFFTEQPKGTIIDICHAEHVVLVDDNPSNLVSMQSHCEKKGVSFDGFHYLANIDRAPHPEPALAAFQKAHLMAHHEWLEDDVARERMALDQPRAKTADSKIL